MMILFLYSTKQQLCLNSTVHPASHSCTMESNVLFLRSGKICPILAACGRHGQSSLHSCVVLSAVPSGIITVSGFFVGLLSCTLAFIAIKCAVAPESSISWVSLDVKSAELRLIGVGYGHVKIFLVLHKLLSAPSSQRGSCVRVIPFWDPLHGFWRVAVQTWEGPGLKQFPL